MKDIPIPAEALSDVLPGSPWRPEPAARYNALNALLRREEEEPVSPVTGSGIGELTVPLFNISEEDLPAEKPVEFVADPREGRQADAFSPLTFGRPVTAEEDILWGIARENIAPGHIGSVQIGGIAAVRGVQGSPARFVTVRPDGRFHFAETGRAEVLYRTGVTNDALIFLGGAGSASCGGMFAVHENSDGSIGVAGGVVRVGETGLCEVEPATLPRPERVSGWHYYVLLLARREADNGREWRFFFSVGDDPEAGYIAGEQLCWPLARLAGGPREPFLQLWQGGMIDFSLRYYLS